MSLQSHGDEYVQARLHVADDEAAAGLQSLAHLMARVQRAAAHAHRQGDDRLQTLRSHESDVSTTAFNAALPFPPFAAPPPLPMQRYHPLPMQCYTTPCMQCCTPFPCVYTNPPSFSIMPFLHSLCCLCIFDQDFACTSLTEACHLFVDMIKCLHPIHQIWVSFYSCALFILTRSKLVVHQSVCTDQLHLLLLMAMPACCTGISPAAAALAHNDDCCIWAECVAVDADFAPCSSSKCSRGALSTASCCFLSTIC